MTGSSQTSQKNITLRSVLMGSALVILQTAATPYNNQYIGGTPIAGNHFPIGSVFIFTLIILALNVVLKKNRPGSELTPAELITIWVMLSVGSGIPYSGLMRYLPPLLVCPVYFATPENEWAELFHDNLPDWLVIKDPKAMQYYYEGLPGGMPKPWGIWLRPALAWTSFVLVMFFVMACICALVRKQWVEREKYTFPLAQLPVDLAERPDGDSLVNSFFRNRLMWFGFALPVVLHGIKGLHMYFPAVPDISTVFDLSSGFTDKPWSALRSLRMVIYPSVIGFSYLLTLEISFSMWFFFLFYKLQSVYLSAVGSSMSGRILASRQAMGGYMALITAMLWTGREHIKTVIRKVMSGKGDDSDEPMPYRLSLIGTVLGIVVLIGMCVLAGMQLGIAIAIIVVFFIIVTILSWMVANAGVLFVQQGFRPSEYLAVTVGTARVNSASWTLLAFESGFMRDLREVLMPSIINAFKVPDPVKLRRRSVIVAVSISILLTLAVSYYAHISITYRLGGNNLESYAYGSAARRAYNWSASSIQSSTLTNWEELSVMGLGAVFTLFIIFMRRSFLWFGIHPMGYLMHLTYAASQVWSSFLIGWLCKYMLLKYGGIKWYRKMRPLFLGAVLGECVIGGIWIVVGMIAGSGYRVLPG